MSLLRLSSVHSYYESIHALKGVSLHVEEGEIVTLIGANGAGKSTTLRTISGLIRPRGGQIEFAGRRIDQMAPHDVARLGVAHVPEGRRVFSRLSVRDNLEMGAYHRSRAALRQAMERVFLLFPRLRERVSQRGGTLSGGEQQMLAIGRALMANPRILLLDEPSMGLAPIIVERIFDTLKDLNAAGTTILLVEQNAHLALQVAHRGYVIQTGEIALEGSAGQLREDRTVRRLYLGEAV